MLGMIGDALCSLEWLLKRLARLFPVKDGYPATDQPISKLTTLPCTQRLVVLMAMLALALFAFHQWLEECRSVLEPDRG